MRVEKQILIEVGRTPDGKWHSRLVMPDGTKYISAACETEADAILERERAFNHVMSCLSDKFNVHVARVQ